MFIRKKKNKSGSTSIQIIDKSSGRYEVIKTIGCAQDVQQENDMMQLGHEHLPALTKQSQIDFSFSEDDIFLKQLQQGLKKIFVVGPELILGKIFDEVGYRQISHSLFRHLRRNTICHHSSLLLMPGYYLPITLQILQA